MSLDKMIDQLAAGLEPVRPLGLPGRRSAVWATAALILVAFVALLLGIRSDLVSRLYDPLFLLEVFVIWSLSVSTCYAALISSIPGEDRSGRSRKIAFVPMLALFALLVMRLAGSYAVAGIEVFLPGLGFSCIFDMLLMGVLPTLVLYWGARKGLPFSTTWLGALIVIAGCSMGSLGLQFTCRDDRAFHVMIWHVLPVLIIALVATKAAHRLLTRSRQLNSD